MPLTPGTRLGAYEILGPLGAGGMGEVYRARDARLDRAVAVKVLPVHLAGDAGLRARFEREAKAVAALSHPHILAIHDFGTQDGIAYAVMELLEGQSLRERLDGGALPLRKAVELAGQMAQGLAAAHEKGVVHRDVKPENLFVTTDGRVKILDFGLARHEPPRANDDASPTLTRETDPGTVMGTVGYMSPEQVRGAAVDHRSDIFSLGCILYEMLTGARAFRRGTAAESMTAILREEPPEIPAAIAEAVPAVARILRHCLEKAPGERFQSARDLAFDLDAALQGSGRSDPLAARVRRRRRVPLVGLLLASMAVAAAIAGGYAWGRRDTRAALVGSNPVFTRLSFGDGTIRSARFGPDGGTVVYGAAWEGQPVRLFLTRVESADAKTLPLGDAEVLAVSASGELAVSLGHTFKGWMGAGTLARAPMLGAAARPVAEGVREADWSPDGSALAVVRRVGDRERLEFPMGTVLFDTAGYVSHIRVSPRGDRVAFAEHPIWADDFGSVAVVDLQGKKTTLTEDWTSLRGIAWSPSGEEVWFTANAGSENAALRAVGLDGTIRSLMSGLTHLLLFDVSPEGRVLLGRETPVRQVEVLAAGSTRPVQVALREQSIGRYVTPDGTAFLITDQGPRGYMVFLHHADGSPPIPLGAGDGYDLSPDRRWVLTLTPDPVTRIWLHPTGAGEPRELPNPDGVVVSSARWLPDGRGVVIVGPTASGPSRAYVLPVEGGPPRPVTPEGTLGVWEQPVPISPGGEQIVLVDEAGVFRVYPLAGGAAEDVPDLTPTDKVLGWTEDPAVVFVGRRTGATWQVRRHDLRTGRGTPWTEIAPAETAGLRLSSVYMTPNGRYWLHSYSRLLTDLYVAEGLR